MKFSRKKLTFIPVLVLISAIIFPSFTALAADASYKFSAINLKLKVPEELICFTQTTTGNNAYLKDIGAEDANEVQNSMKASNIYLEALLPVVVWVKHINSSGTFNFKFIAENL